MEEKATQCAGRLFLLPISGWDGSFPSQGFAATPSRSHNPRRAGIFYFIPASLFCQEIWEDGINAEKKRKTSKK